MNEKRIPNKFMELYELTVLENLAEDGDLMLSHQIANEETQRAIRLEETQQQIRLNKVRQSQKSRFDFKGLITLDHFIDIETDTSKIGGLINSL